MKHTITITEHNKIIERIETEDVEDVLEAFVTQCSICGKNYKAYKDKDNELYGDCCHNCDVWNSAKECIIDGILILNQGNEDNEYLHNGDALEPIINKYLVMMWSEVRHNNLITEQQWRKYIIKKSHNPNNN